MDIEEIELGMISALGIGVDIRLFAVEGSTGSASRQKWPQPSWAEARSVAEKHWIA